MEVFNASTQDRPGLRYGSVVTLAPGPPACDPSGAPGSTRPTRSPTRSSWPSTGSPPAPRRNPFRASTGSTRPCCGAPTGGIPDAAANDGIVPTLSQIHGELLAAAWADHHDILGHYNQPSHVPPHFDWMSSGTGFDREGFERAWKRVAIFASTI